MSGFSQNNQTKHTTKNDPERVYLNNILDSFVVFAICCSVMRNFKIQFFLLLIFFRSCVMSNVEFLRAVAPHICFTCKN